LVVSAGFGPFPFDASLGDVGTLETWEIDGSSAYYSAVPPEAGLDPRLDWKTLVDGRVPVNEVSMPGVPTGIGIGTYPFVVNITRGQVLYSPIGALIQSRSRTFVRHSTKDSTPGGNPLDDPVHPDVMAYLNFIPGNVAVRLFPLSGFLWDWPGRTNPPSLYDYTNQWGPSQSVDATHAGEFTDALDLWDQQTGQAPFINRGELYLNAPTTQTEMSDRWIVDWDDKSFLNFLNPPYPNDTPEGRYISIIDSDDSSDGPTVINHGWIGGAVITDLKIVRRPKVLEVLTFARRYDEMRLWVVLDKSEGVAAPFVVNVSFAGAPTQAKQISLFEFTSGLAIEGQPFTVSDGRIRLESASGHHALYRAMLAKTSTSPMKNLIKLADLNSGEVVTVQDITNTNGSDPEIDLQWVIVRFPIFEDIAPGVEFFTVYNPVIVQNDYLYAGVEGRNQGFLSGWTYGPPGKSKLKNAKGIQILTVAGLIKGKKIDVDFLLNGPAPSDKVTLTALPKKAPRPGVNDKMKTFPASWTDTRLPGPHAISARVEFDPLPYLVPAGVVRVIQSPALGTLTKE